LEKVEAFPKPLIGRSPLASWHFLVMLGRRVAAQPRRVSPKGIPVFVARR